MFCNLFISYIGDSLLSDKYAPTTLNGVIGNYASVKRLTEFSAAVHAGARPRPIIIYGPTGTGKTAAAHALAAGNGFELFELNASDFRDVERLRRVLLPASRSRGLFNKNILILMDEIDELSKKFDHGAESIVKELIDTSRQPVIFTATDYWDQKITFLRNTVERIEFKKVNHSDIGKLLQRIAKQEGHEIAPEVLGEITKRSDGDVRGAINDLELMLGAKPELLDNLGWRDRPLEIYGVLDKIFTTSSFDASRTAVSKTDIDLGMLINWVDENIPNRYPAQEELDDAYSSLALASKFYEKAGRTSYYGYYRYVNVLISSGISLANNGRVTMLRPYAFPTKIRHLSATKGERGALNAAAERLSLVLHTNKKYIIRTYLPMIKKAIEGSIKRLGVDKTLETMANSFNLYPDDVEAILGRKLS